MTIFLKKFGLTTQYDEYINSDIALLPNVSLTIYDNMIHYNPAPNYFTFIAEEDNSTISLTSKTSPDIKYSLNGGVWTQWNYSAITLNTGDTIRMKGNNSSGFSTSSSNYNQFQMTGKISASGNIMSLLYENDFEEQLTIPCGYCFYRMFYDCTGLTTAPKLPATTLADGCYNNMFSGCTNLTTAPKLPATTLANYCYEYMFKGCTSLTKAPELPATKLADYCYQYMFYGCSSLTKAPELPAPPSSLYCYRGMFRGCTSLTKAPELSYASLLATGCYNSMFYGCTSLTKAPKLPAYTLPTYCYSSMFYNCTSLNDIIMLATDVSATDCLTAWVTNVASSGTFIKDASTTLPTGDNGIPNGWTVYTVHY